MEMVVGRLAVVLATLALVGCGDSEPESAPPDQDRWSDVVEVSTGVEEAFVLAVDDVVIQAGVSRTVAIDPVSMQVRWDVPFTAYGAAEGFGSLWLTDFDARLVRRVDPATGEVQSEIPLEGTPYGVAVVGGGVWIALHQQGMVVRLDPKTEKVVGTVDLGPFQAAGPQWIAADDRYVYVGVPNQDLVAQIDTERPELVHTISTGDLDACGPLLIDGPVVWAGGCFEDDGVARLDFSTREAVISDSLGVYVGGGIVTDSGVWFAGVEDRQDAGSGVLVAFDPVTAEEIDRVDGPESHDSAVAAFGSFWVTTQQGMARIPLTALQR